MDDEKKLVKSLFHNKMGDECFMLSMTWWNKWKEYVNYEDVKMEEEKGKQSMNPGKISNFELLYSIAALLK